MYYASPKDDGQYLVKDKDGVVVLVVGTKHGAEVLAEAMRTFASILRRDSEVLEAQSTNRFMTESE